MNKMRKLFFPINKKFCIALCALGCFTLPLPSFAGETINVGEDIASALISLYNSAITFIAKAWFAPDVEATNVITTNNALFQKENIKKHEDLFNNSIMNMVSYYLSEKNQKDVVDYRLSLLTAEDNNPKGARSDLPSNANNIKDPASYQDFLNKFFGAELMNANVTSVEGNKILNINSLLSPLQYDEEQPDSDQQALDAQAFIQYVEKSAPSSQPVTLKANLTIPYSPATGRTSMVMKNVTQDDAKKIGDFLDTKTIYTKYKLTYRSDLASRLSLLNSLLQSYQDRVGTQKEPSVAKLAFMEANWRLQDPENPDSFYQQMLKAPPATIARHSLQLLAEIHNDLYNIQRQNERMIILQSITGLHAIAMTGLMGAASSEKQIGQLIYCYYCKPTDAGGLGHSDNATVCGEKKAGQPQSYEKACENVNLGEDTISEANYQKILADQQK